MEIILPGALIHRIGLPKKVKLFFNYSTGFKAPSLNQLYGQYGPNPDLKPEKSESIEGGAQFISPNNKIDVRVVAFARISRM